MLGSISHLVQTLLCHRALDRERAFNCCVNTHCSTFSRMMPDTKHCKWGTCTSDSRDVTDDTPITFFSFPKPCKDFKLLEKDPSVKIQHDQQLCIQCQKSQKWVNACKLKKFVKISQINYDTWICSKHFVAGKPTEEHLNPLSAGSFFHWSIMWSQLYRSRAAKDTGWWSFAGHWRTCCGPRCWRRS